MKLGERVHLKFSPESKGTITGFRGGDVRITWDSPENKKPGVKRVRFWYPAASIETIGRGNP